MVFRWVKGGLIGLATLAVLIQFVPYGRDHSNPPVVQEPSWDSPQIRELAVGACFDCHSNETVWPWYSNLAPISWLTQRDVEQGREALNFSEWHLEQEGDEAAETVRDGSMPPWQYTLTHSEARLSADQVAAVEAGLVATFGDDRSEEDAEDSSDENPTDDDSSG
jgi:mono/diheme cytochrome c family protein